MKIFKLPKILISLLLLIVMKNNNFSDSKDPQDNQLIIENDKKIKNFFLILLSLGLGVASTVIIFLIKQLKQQSQLPQNQPVQPVLLHQEVDQSLIQQVLLHEENHKSLIQEVKMSGNQEKNEIKLNNLLKDCYKKIKSELQNDQHSNLITKLENKNSIYSTLNTLSRQSKKYYDNSLFIKQYFLVIRTFFIKTLSVKLPKEDLNKLDYLHNNKFALLLKIINDDELMKISECKKWIDDLIVFINQNKELFTKYTQQFFQELEEIKISIEDKDIIKKIIDKDLIDLEFLKFIVNYTFLFNQNQSLIMSGFIMNDDNEKFPEEVKSITMTQDENNDDFINKVIELSLNNFVKKYQKQLN